MISQLIKYWKEYRAEFVKLNKLENDSAELIDWMLQREIGFSDFMKWLEKKGGEE